MVIWREVCCIQALVRVKWYNLIYVCMVQRPQILKAWQGKFQIFNKLFPCHSCTMNYTVLFRPYKCRPKFSIRVKLSFAIFCFPCGLGLISFVIDKEQYLMTSNSRIFPLVDIIQGHFRKSFEALVKIVGCGWWLTVNVVSCWPWWETLLWWGG